MDVEFGPGDQVIFKPYEIAIKSKVRKLVPASKVTFVPNDDRIFYELTGVDRGKNLKTVTTGGSIVESKYYKGGDNK